MSSFSLSLSFSSFYVTLHCLFSKRKLRKHYYIQLMSKQKASVDFLHVWLAGMWGSREYPELFWTWGWDWGWDWCWPVSITTNIEDQQRRQGGCCTGCWLNWSPVLRGRSPGDYYYLISHISLLIQMKSNAHLHCFLHSIMFPIWSCTNVNSWVSQLDIGHLQHWSLLSLLSSWQHCPLKSNISLLCNTISLVFAQQDSFTD